MLYRAAGHYMKHLIAYSTPPPRLHLIEGQHQSPLKVGAECKGDAEMPNDSLISGFASRPLSSDC